MKAVFVIATVIIVSFNVSASGQLLTGNTFTTSVKHKRLRLYAQHDSDSRTDERLICKYSCDYDDPRSIDEEYWQNVDITFMSPPVIGKTYVLSHKDITISGKFSSAWVWDLIYADTSTMGRIRVIRYKNRRKLVLALDLYQFWLSPQRDTISRRILQGKFKFH